MDQLPARPATVTYGAMLLLGSALVLILAWVLGVDGVSSNGARIFFIVVWGYLAFAAYRGAGWVRIAIVGIFGVTVWGGINAPSWDSALQRMTAGDIVAKGLALVALAVLCAPAARSWFAAARQLRDGEG